MSIVKTITVTGPNDISIVTVGTQGATVLKVQKVIRVLKVMCRAKDLKVIKVK